MAVVERLRAKGKKVYGVSNEWQGKATWELVGTSRRAAEARDREMKREIKNGTYVPKDEAVAVTVAQFAEVWGNARTNASAKEERRVIQRYIVSDATLAKMVLGDVKPKHVMAWVERWRAKCKEDGSRLILDKTVANAVSVLRMVFDAALLKELCLSNPVQLPKKALKRSVTKSREIYSLAECVVLIRHHAIPWPIRVLNAMLLLTGMRLGEACGRRWRDLDDGPKPLSLMRVHDQYDGRALKTEQTRLVPIHPELHLVLTEWAKEGFELYTGAKPTPDDYIVPNVSHRALVPHHTMSSFYRQFVKHAKAAGVRPRTIHATRHSFITHCRRGGARKEVLERVTHNAKGDIVDGYTHWDWAPLCEAVNCLDLDAHRTPQLPSKTPEEIDGSFLAGIHGDSGKNPNFPQAAVSVLPAVPVQKHLVGQSARKTRQEIRQGASGNFEEGLRSSNKSRKRTLLSLSEVDHAGAKPGLALCRTLDAVYDGDLDEARKQLAKADHAMVELEGGADEDDGAVAVRGVA
jgi:integrase